MENQEIITKICKQLKLGILLEKPLRLFGGLMHKMYRVKTNVGIFAIKLLNPKIMQRDDALQNYKLAELLESKLQAASIPIVAALQFNGTKMQQIDNQYCYIFNFVNGSSLKYKEITKEHCAKIASVLAKIHKIESKKESGDKRAILIDWQKYIVKAQTQCVEIFTLLKDNIGLILKSQNDGNAAFDKVSKITAICHGDMDCKNVLWTGNSPQIIDLECLSYGNPHMEFFELALSWSGLEQHDINYDLLETFAMAYIKQSGALNIDWKALYYSNNSRLLWLEYNIKRALLIECNSEEERLLGISQAEETIQHLQYYDKIKDQLLKKLTRINKDGAMKIENTPTLKTDRLILRKFTENDVEDILALYSDEAVNKFLPWFTIKTLEAATSYLNDTILPQYAKDVAYSYAIALQQSDKVIGYVHVNDIGGANDIGYAVAKQYWHKGIVTEACMAIVQHLKQVGLPYLTATHDILNPSSGAVLIKLGMQYKYCYIEQWQPKNITVTFKMYQLNLDGNDERVYTKYCEKYNNAFIEKINSI